MSCANWTFSRTRVQRVSVEKMWPKEGIFALGIIASPQAVQLKEATWSLFWNSASFPLKFVQWRGLCWILSASVHCLLLTPDVCGPCDSTQTPSSSCLPEGTSSGSESLIVSLFKTASPSGLMEKILLKMKPELLCFQQYNNAEWCWETLQGATPASCQELREHYWTATFLKLCTVHLSHSCRRWVPRSTLIFWGGEKSFRPETPNRKL